MIYASRGMFVPRGTDTVPAMLTPGEFVINRSAVNRGNNLQMLKMINGSGGASQGMAAGGQVGYYKHGGGVMGGLLGALIGGPMGAVAGAGGGMFAKAGKAMMDPIGTMESAFAKFSDSIEKLKTLNLAVTLSPTDINVTFNNTTFLAALSDTIKDEVLSEVQKQIPRLSQDSSGKMGTSDTVLNTQG